MFGIRSEMDSLKDYGTDSDNDQDNGNEDESVTHANSETVTNSETEQNKSHLSVAADADQISTRTDSQKLNRFNLFGIEYESKYLTQNQSQDRSQDQTQKSRTIQTNYGELEIPNGDFWREFTPDEITEVKRKQSSHCEYFKYQTGEHMTSGITLSDKNLSDSTSSYSHNSLKRSRDKGTQSYPHGHGYKQIRQDCKDSVCVESAHSNPDVGFQNCNRQSSANVESESTTSVTSPQEMRKLYFVHSKVAPYVHTKTSNKCPSKMQMSWTAHEGVVNRLQWNVPNYSHLLLSAGMDTEVQVWNVWSSLDKCKVRLNCHKKAVKHAEWCQQGRRILSCSFDRTAQLTDVEREEVVAVCEHINFVTAGCTHPGNPSLFVTGTENWILMWDSRTPEAPVRHFSYKDKFGQVQDLLFIKDNQELISCVDLVSRDSADRGIMAWDVRSGVVLSNQIFQERYTCTRLKTHPNRSHFLAQTQGDYIAIFSTSSPYKMDKSKRYDGHKMHGYGIGFDLSSDGSLVYSGSAENGVHCYDHRSGRLTRKLSSGRDIIMDVACHPVLPSVIASCTWGGRIDLWQ